VGAYVYLFTLVTRSTLKLSKVELATIEIHRSYHCNKNFPDNGRTLGSVMLALCLARQSFRSEVPGALLHYRSAQ